jgi:hypothetical protein
MELEKEEAIMKVILDDYHLIGLPRGTPSFLTLNQKRMRIIEKFAELNSRALSKLKTINYVRGHPEMYPDQDLEALIDYEQEIRSLLRNIKDIISLCLDDPNYHPNMSHIKDPQMKIFPKYAQTSRSSISS